MTPCDLTPTCVCPQATAASGARWMRMNVRWAPVSTGASACSAPTQPSMGASRPPSQEPSASAMLLASCAAALWALRVSPLPGKQVCSVQMRGRDAEAGFKHLSLASVSLAIRWALSSSSLALRELWEPQLGFLQGTTAVWTWTSVPHGHASVEASARTCPMASSATVQMATQVPGVRWALGQGKVRCGGPGARRFLLADVWRLD